MVFRRRRRRARFKEEALPHRDALFRAALGMVNDPSTAEDLVQETYHEAWKSFHRYQAGSDCKAWLFRILFRVRGKHLRREGRFQWVELDEVPNEAISVQGGEMRHLEAREALQVVQSLPEHYRTALVLADAEGFSYQEISQILELPIGTVMSRLNRARRMLRDKLLKASEDKTA